MVKRPKKYYSAGVISLVLLPILVITTWKFNGLITMQRGLELLAPVKNMHYSGKNPFLGYKYIELTGDTVSDNKKLDTIPHFLSQLHEETSAAGLGYGLRVHIQSGVQYAYLIKLLDLVKNEQICTFTFEDDDLLVFTRFSVLLCDFGREPYFEPIPFLSVSDKRKREVNLSFNNKLCEVLALKRWWGLGLIYVALVFMAFFTGKYGGAAMEGKGKRINFIYSDVLLFAMLLALFCVVVLIFQLLQ